LDSNDWLHPSSTGYLLKIQVVPGAAENKIIGPYGDRLKIRIAAIPEKGSANKTLLDFLAHRLGLTKNQVRLKSGGRDRSKLIEIVSSEPHLRELLLSLWPGS
jgi:uncharacterized protein (TIGR00251 family)